MATFDMTKLSSIATSFAISFVIASIIFLVGYWISKKVVNIATKIMIRSKLDETIAHFLGNVLYAMLMVAVIMAVLSQLGVNTAPIMAIVGGAVVAIGFSLKDQLSNFAAGVLIVIFRPFRNGDFVEIDGLKGTVLKVSLMNTRLMTINNHEVIIPNSQVTTNATTNYTSLPSRRVDVPVGIDYKSDIKKAKEVILQVAATHKDVFVDPAPIVSIMGLGDNSVDLELRAWTSNQVWREVRSDLLEEIKYKLDENHIGIPFPQRTVHIVKEEHATEE